MSHSFRDNALGAGLMMASMAAFTINDTFMKLLAPDWPLMQSIFVRGVLASTLLGAIAWYRGFGWGRFAGSDWRLIGLRTGTEIAATYFFLSALFHMPIANVTAIIQALPLTVTLAGAVFLREAIGWRRIAAIAVGAIGVLLIVRPGSDGFDAYSVYGLLAVVAVTARDITSRQLKAQVPTFTVAFIAALAITCFAGINALFVDWVPVERPQLTFVACAAVFIILGYTLSVQVMRQGEIAFIAPFRYTSLVAALILGWLVFGEWPDGLTLLGASIVVLTGLFAFWREQVAARKA